MNKKPLNTIQDQQEDDNTSEIIDDNISEITLPANYIQQNVQQNVPQNVPQNVTSGAWTVTKIDKDGIQQTTRGQIICEEIDPILERLMKLKNQYNNQSSNNPYPEVSLDVSDSTVSDSTVSSLSKSQHTK